MRSVDAILQDLSLAKESNNREAFIALCREGARLFSSPDTEEWYVFRVNLANFLISENRTINTHAIEEAIQIYLQLTSSQWISEGGKRANTLMGLGRAYDLRKEGDLRTNLERAVEAYKEALKFYTKESDPYTWANLKVALALIFSKLSAGTNRSYFSKAIKSYEEALHVFTFADYPEDWKEITVELGDLRNRAISLKSKKRPKNKKNL